MVISFQLFWWMLSELVMLMSLVFLVELLRVIYPRSAHTGWCNLAAVARSHSAGVAQSLCDL